MVRVLVGIGVVALIGLGLFLLVSNDSDEDEPSVDEPPRPTEQGRRCPDAPLVADEQLDEDCNVVPESAPALLEDGLYPNPVSSFDGIGYLGGCPSLEAVRPLPADAVETAAAAVTAFRESSDVKAARRATDKTLWRHIRDSWSDGQPGSGIDRPLEIIASSSPDTEDIYTQIVDDQCGADTVSLSWVVRTCRVTCGEPGASANPIIDHFLINRMGVWLIYAIFD
ncbi:MAG: hypothetical protein WEB00_04310 [Dehalococcoidia bacterium]